MARSGRHRSGREDGGLAGRSDADEDGSLQLFQRARERSQLRAALALEEAGELEEAARLFEYVGEHAQAAALRLEHAQTLRDERSRLRVLREGAARNPGTSEQGRALHKALAKALRTRAEAQEDGALRRGLQLEAAEALEEAGIGDEAGDIYETLGLLARAARAYEAAGAIARLEVVLALLDRREQAERALDRVEREIESAVRLGRRKHAHGLLDEHARERQRQGRDLRHQLAQIQAHIEEGLPRRRRVALRCRTPNAVTGKVVRIVGTARLRIGRAPDAEFVVQGAALSREHVELRVDLDDGGTPTLILADRGARAGTFWHGDPLEPGVPEPIGDGGELGLGIAVAIEVIPGGSPDRPYAFVRVVGSGDPWTIFAPLGCRLAVEPTLALPATISFDDPYVTVTADPDIRVHLEQEPLGTGAPVEILIRDRLAFTPADGDGPRFEIEVLDLFGSRA